MLDVVVGGGGVGVGGWVGRVDGGGGEGCMQSHKLQGCV